MPSMQDAISRAHRIAREQHLDISSSRINRAVRKTWNHTPELSDADLYKCLTYSDPTGDKATNSALKGSAA
ncbi:hypothetical protein GS504_20695 [Rhodococcus hoagii]|nr:hypothetical protein [Prescottella equi]NKS59870.1 hypothetical protein [Prescottella equi]NKZ71385.1 hypothetical protein [Prescottella equi]